MQFYSEPHDPLEKSKIPKTKLPFEYSRALVHFKNCIHDGFFTLTMKREGPGITILDNGTIILGNYRNDQNNSMCLIWIDMETYFIGEFNIGALDGPFVVRTPSLTFYSSFTNNKIQGELLIIDYNNCVAQLWAVEGNGEGQICKELNLSEVINSFITYEQIRRAEGKLQTYPDKTKFISQEPIILKTIAPYIEKMPNVAEFIKTMKAGSQEFQGIGPPIFTHKLYQNNELIILNPSSSTQNSFLGFAINKREELIAYGQFREVDNVEKVPGRERVTSYQSNYQLHGMGAQVVEIENGDRKQERVQKIILSGEFLNNELHGEACKEIEGERIIYGKFVEGAIRNADITKVCKEKDDEIKKLELKRNRNIHIHSLKFYNNYSNERPTFIIRNLIEMMTSNNHEYSGEY